MNSAHPDDPRSALRFAVPPRLRARGGVHSAGAGGGPGVQPRADAGAGAAGATSGTRRWRCSRSWAVGLLERRPVPPGRPARRGGGSGRRELVEASRELCRCCWWGRRCASRASSSTARVLIHRGRMLGVVPKTYLPNYREFYEKRQFAARPPRGRRRRSALAGSEVPFGNDLVFEAETCRSSAPRGDLRGPVGAGAAQHLAALAGATVLVNLSASQHHGRQGRLPPRLCARRSRASASPPTSIRAAGPGESTTDLAWDGHALIYENDELLAESRAVSQRGADDGRRRRSRAAAPGPMRMTSFRRLRWPSTERRRGVCAGSASSSRRPASAGGARAPVDRFPYVPRDPRELR